MTRDHRRKTAPHERALVSRYVHKQRAWCAGPCASTHRGAENPPAHSALVSTGRSDASNREWLPPPSEDAWQPWPFPLTATWLTFAWAVPKTKVDKSEERLGTEPRPGVPAFPLGTLGNTVRPQTGHTNYGHDSSPGGSLLHV